MSKDTITLRRKKLKNGRYSLYLDYYCNGKRQPYEFLQMYLDGSPQDTHTLEVAEVIRRKRYQQLTGQELPSDRITTFEKYVEHSTLLNSSHKIAVFKKWKRTNAETPFNKLFDAVRLFMNVIHKKAPNTQHNYMAFVAMCIRKAEENDYCDARTVSAIIRYIRHNLPKIPKRRLPKFLTVEEFIELYYTEPEPKDAQICKAFIFSCMTGLRISDVFNLRPENIDKHSRTLIVKQQKTKADVVIALNDIALSLVELPYSTDKVFLLPERKKVTGSNDRVLFHNIANKALNRWAERAGIHKKITFHVARHTFATTLINKGVPIYVIQKLLGHASGRQTEIYLELQMKPKHEAVDFLTNLATPDTDEQKKARKLRALEEEARELLEKIERLKQS